MRWKVSGVDARTGKDCAVTLDAESEAAAIESGGRHGVMAERALPLGAAAGSSPTNGHADTAEQIYLRQIRDCARQTHFWVRLIGIVVASFVILALVGFVAGWCIESARADAAKRDADRNAAAESAKLSAELREEQQQASSDLAEKADNAKRDLITASHLNARQSDWLNNHLHDTNFNELLKQKIQEHADESK